MRWLLKSPPAGKSKRAKENMMNNPYDFTNLSGAFQALIVNPELMFQFFDMFPIPIEIFAPDGTSVYLNRALLELNNIPDANLIVGKYNLVNDPVCNDQLGLREGIQRAFRGETVELKDFPAPIQDLVDRGVIEGKPYEAVFMDLYLFPVWNGDQLAYVVNIFVVKRMYQGRPDVAKAKEYMNSHWQDEFNPNAVAKAVNMSTSQLYSLFKQHTEMAPGDYYKKCKVDHIKEKLEDKTLTIAEAFAACGEDSRGTYARVFREITGVSPKEYRMNIENGMAITK